MSDLIFEEPFNKMVLEKIKAKDLQVNDVFKNQNKENLVTKILIFEKEKVSAGSWEYAKGKMLVFNNCRSRTLLLEETVLIVPREFFIKTEL